MSKHLNNDFEQNSLWKKQRCNKINPYFFVGFPLTPQIQVSFVTVWQGDLGQVPILV